MPNLKLLGSVAVLAGGFAAAGQAPPPEPKYGYEVASIKKSDPAARGTRIGPGAQGGMKTMNTNVMTLLTFAYDVHDYQIIDAPGWARGEGFDVSFTPDQPELFPTSGPMHLKTLEPMLDRQRQRLQAILRDRFELKLHLETRELPIYTLTIAKSGLKMTPSDGKSGGPSMNMNSNKELTGRGANLRMLTSTLSNILQRPVVDHTGLGGTFDLKMQWKPDTLVMGGAGEAPVSVSDGDGASIFTAITEQLGLKLESKKGPVTVYVVENVERPSEN